ncbi:hypothetical protein GUITHDRAFT_160006 [Guillardia theta CCMP2712]|uniref:Uncharacterized protein n=1 Tax=Guillardia theta (strain CCMP2712) TaxID=905079 RepID=L1IT40_GUITC|nr:hypothetical protein GUITHDRAFT_160006 [Guillardia theta CCMP2712]EKX39426.1 hypothetical protein GUITHDRAFT_160006 [Guillardia theta CCMP2712]|eukprot:XP_005826406.1 hypothetical protein GUITHDRAFT_160006 [Guillardia theta CCMP2712]
MEMQRGLQRGSEVKLLWIVNFLMQAVRFRVAVLYYTFMEPDSPASQGERASADTVSFIFSTILLAEGLMERPRIKSAASVSYGKMEGAQEGDEKLDAAKTKGEALKRVWLHDFIICGFFKLINDTVVFIGPLLLQSLVRFVESGGDGTQRSSAVDGAILAIGIFLAKTVESMAVNQYFHYGYRIGGQVRAAMTMLVYRKAFLLSSKGYQNFKIGEMVSLMSVDAQRLCSSAPYLHLFWSAPLQLTVATILLYNLLGASVFGGLMIMIVMIPLSTYIAKKRAGLNRTIMKIKDERSNCMDEVLQGIRVIKYFAWEQSFTKKVQEVRNREVDLIWKNSLWAIFSTFLWAGSPMLVALISFTFYSLSGNELRPNIAFTALALFNVLRFPLNTLPMIINIVVESQVALGRLTNYLLADEVDKKKEEEVVSEVPIVIQDGRFSWSNAPTAKQEDAAKATTFLSKLLQIFKGVPKMRKGAELGTYNCVLRDIDLEVRKGELCMVAGKVGCGKTSLLCAILGEMRRSRGACLYLPWIKNATVRDNILFGSEYDEEKYGAVIEVCALLQDFEVLPAGDQTEIGEKGINLSGGQKARISLARAVYQDADVYLLDDPLSAVDVHVSKHLFEECVKTYLKGKTIILVTHQIQYLPGADKVLYLDSNRIVAQGTFASISEAHPHLIDTSHGPSMSRNNSQDDLSKTADLKSASSDKLPNGTDGTNGEKKARVLKSQSSTGLDSKQTITKEARKSGTVPLAVWTSYARSMGLHIAGSVILAYVISQLIQSANDFWLTVWSSAYLAHDQAAELQTEQTTPAPVNTGFYLGIYALITLISLGSVTVRSGFVAIGALRASVKLHNGMLERVLRAPTRFFDTTPTGRVLNRFTSDMYTLDNEMRETLSMMLMCLVRVIQVSLVIIYVTPTFLPIVIPLSYVYYRVQEFYRNSSRELKRLESVAKSPIFAQFSETLNGLSTIRSFGSQHNFVHNSQQLNDCFSRAYFGNNASNRWLAVRLEFIGNIAIGCASLFAVLQNASDPAAAGLVGLSITYALEVTGTLNWSIRTFTQLESYMVAAERVEEYTTMETEAPAIVDSYRTADSWPSEGKLSFDNVKLRYREGLEPALKGITFATEAGEKVGIVGRTGAGKSTLAVALFRMVEIFEGTILLDGVDISKIGLDDLRKNVSIIPQDPVLFTGTIRSNLDPFSEYSDSSVDDALSKVHMLDYVRSNGGLLHVVQEGGKNLSVGQRQLLCMARALLRNAKVIVMDEATASVDMQTDSFIQETIREQFKHSTVLTIAHRLDTIKTCDRVMVLGEGRVLEMGHPSTLQKDTTSIFYKMTSDSAAAAEMLS